MRLSSLAKRGICFSLFLAASSLHAQAKAGTFYIGTYARNILVMDEASMKITDSIPVSIGIPYSIQLSYDRKHFYILEPRLQTVEIIDIPTRKPIGTFNLNMPSKEVRITGMNVDPTERFAVMVIRTTTLKSDRYEIAPPKLVKFDLASKTVTDTIPWPLGQERDFAQILFSPNGENLFFFTGEDVLIYDTKTLKMVEKWDIARTYYEEGFGRLPTNFANQLNEEPGYNTSLFRVSDPVNHRTLMGIARTNLMNRSIDWYMLGPPGLSAPGGISLAPGRKRAYGLVQQVGNYQYWIFDLENKRVVGKVDFNGHPRMILTAATDPKYVYLHGAGSTIEIRDANTFASIRTVQLDADMTGAILIPPGPGPVPVRPGGQH